MAANSITPPSGFLLDKPSTPNGVTPPAGFVLDTPAQSAPQPQTSTASQVADGFGAGAADMMITAGKIGSHIPGVKTASNLVGDAFGLPRLDKNIDPYEAVEQGTANARQKALTPTAGKVGYGLEGLAEFITGDEAIKSFSYGERLLKAARLTKLIEQSPRLSKAVEIGMAAFRQATIGGTQGLAHGETGKEALESGAFAGITSGVTEAGLEGAKALAPKLKEIAGELIPIRGSEKSALARAGENIASSNKLQEFDVNQTQPGARKAIGKIASDIKAPEVSNAKPLPPAADIGERAEQVRTQAKPVFEKLDDLTKDREMKFSDWQKAEKSAFRRGDYEAAMKAKAQQQAIISEFKGHFAPDDLTNARSAWAQAANLDKVDKALNTRAILQPTPVELRPQGAPDAGVINGRAFSKAVLDLKTKGTLQAAGLTADHIQSLQDLGTLLEQGNNVRKLSSLLSPRNAAMAESIGFVLSPGKAIAAAKAGAPALTASKVLAQVMTEPKAAKGLINLMRFVDATAPGIAAQIPSGNPRTVYDDTKDMLSNRVASVLPNLTGDK